MKNRTRRLLAGATATALSAAGAIALQAPSAQAADGGVLLYGLTTTDEVVQFRAETDAAVSRARIQVAGGEDVVGIDVRPATGELYAVVRGASQDRVVVVDPVTGAVSGAAVLSTRLEGVNFGVDFNPVPDRLRIVSDAEQNLRVDVTTGAVTVDGRLAYAAGGARSGDPSVRGAAYTQNVAGTTSTVLYGYDAAGVDTIVRQDPPNDGTLIAVEPAPGTVATESGPLSTATSTVTVGFDVEAVTNTAFVLVGQPDGSRSLFRSTTPIGSTGQTTYTQFGGGVINQLDDVTVASARLTVQDAVGAEGGVAQVRVTRSGDLGDTATVVLTPSDVSAVAADYDGTPRTAVFGVGATSAVVDFPLTTDALLEGDETFRVTLGDVRSGAGNAAATARTGTVTITNVVPPAAASPSPSSSAPTMTPSPAPTDPRPSLSPAPPGAKRLGIRTLHPFITPGVPSTIVISGEPGVAAELYAYSRPSTQYRRVRAATIPSDGTLELPILPGTNTRLFAAVAGQTGNESLSLVVNVRTAISLSVRKTGTRTYVFEGRLLPRNQATLVSLYRVTPQGREVLTAQTRSQPAADGLYRITRTFTGTGRFFFAVRTSQTLINAPGLSNVRQVTIS